MARRAVQAAGTDYLVTAGERAGARGGAVRRTATHRATALSAERERFDTPFGR